MRTGQVLVRRRGLPVDGLQIIHWERLSLVQARWDLLVRGVARPDAGDLRSVCIPPSQVPEAESILDHLEEAVMAGLSRELRARLDRVPLESCVNSVRPRAFAFGLVKSSDDQETLHELGILQQRAE